ncbi:MAG: hypothetical protein E6J47_03970 [Chloroflexi bacterium]|nr:MAG: hypothetical protein E6J47_03970 [Chloroflexota bacterium]
MYIFRFIALLALIGLAAVIGVNVYNAGVATGLSQAAHAAIASGNPAPVVYYPGWGGYPGFGWGFGFFGFIFLIFGFFLVIGLLRAAFGRGRGYGHAGWSGHGSWKGRTGPRDYLEDWHKEAHGESPAAPDKTS